MTGHHSSPARSRVFLLDEPHGHHAPPKPKSCQSYPEAAKFPNEQPCLATLALLCPESLKPLNEPADYQKRRPLKVRKSDSRTEIQAVSVVSLNSNIASLKAIRKLGQASEELSSTFERLSSGQRINRASDDAAGLAVASTLNAKAKVYTQAVRNINDGISLLNVADGAVTQLKNIISRQLELSEQSANGVYSNTQRAALQTEMDALNAEYNRIISTTSFNNINLLNGGGSPICIQAGQGSQAILKLQLTSSAQTAVGSGTFSLARSFVGNDGTNEDIAIDINHDGHMDYVQLTAWGDSICTYVGNGDATFKAPVTSLATVNFQAASLVLADLNGDGKEDAVTSTGSSSNDFYVMLGQGNGTFAPPVSYKLPAAGDKLVLADMNGDGKLDVVDTYSSGATVVLGNGNGTFGAKRSYSIGSDLTQATVADFNKDGKMDLVALNGTTSTARVLFGDGAGSFSSQVSLATTAWPGVANVGDFNNDGWTDVVVGDISYLKLFLNNGSGGFNGAIDNQATPSNINEITVADLNGDNKLDVVGSYDGPEQAFISLGNGDGTFKDPTTYLTAPSAMDRPVVADFNEDGVVDFLVSEHNGNTTQVYLGGIVAGTSAVSVYQTRPVISDQQSAFSAITTLRGSLANLENEAGAIGSLQSRLSFAARMVATTSDVFRAAEGRIIDADVAFESANLVRTQILQQAASAVLAQANQQPALALMLLGGRSR